MTTHEGDVSAMPTSTDPIAALIEADKKRLLDIQDETENLTNALNFIAAAANAMPAIVEMVEENEAMQADIIQYQKIAADQERENERLMKLEQTLMDNEHPALRIYKYAKENERLRAELAGLKEELSTQEQNLIGYQNAANYWKGNYDKSQAELAECRKDAERYRWLRDHYHGFAHYRIATGHVASLDSDVDRQLAALAQQKGKEEST